MSSPSKRTRRMFLADLLFLTGGLTAAALIAEGFDLVPTERSPQVVGEMTIPTNPAQSPECPPTPLEVKPEARVRSEPKPSASRPIAPRPIARKPKTKGYSRPAVTGMYVPPRSSSAEG